jgi:RNA polymerase sigma-70 factor (ECF subfamily)
MSALREKFLAFRVSRYADREAYGEIYDLFADRIRRFLVFKLPRTEDADELTNEVFLRGWEYMSSGTVNNLNAFFFRIARNLIADFYRKYKITEDIQSAEVLDAGISVERDVAIKLEGDDLLGVLRTLKDEYREVLVMRYLSEMEVGEIASALEKTSNGVRVLLHRAKKALQEKVDHTTV